MFNLFPPIGWAILVMLTLIISFLYLIRKVVPSRTGLRGCPLVIAAAVVTFLVILLLHQGASALEHLTSPAPVHAATTTHAVVRLNQLDASEYASLQEASIWGPSACSATAMTEVLNSYGLHLRITDVLSVERSIGEITPELGLLEDAGISKTVAHFGFTATWGHQLNLDQVIATANGGHPTIVSFPPQPAFPTGHILVVAGGSPTSVTVVDSSSFHLKILSRSRFSSLWRGFSAVVTPKGA